MNSTGARRAERLPYPVDAAAAAAVLAQAGLPWFWLDGEAAPADEERVSYLGVAHEVRTAERGREREFLAGLETGAAAPAAAAARVPAAAPREEVGFGGGWVVALGYEFGVSLLGADPSPDHEAPALALRVGAVLAIDHGTGAAVVRGAAADVAAFVREYGAALRDAAPLPQMPVGGLRVGTPGGPIWRRSDAEYGAEVESCREAIRDGDAYVLCLTDIAEARGEWEPLAVYLGARAHGTAARGGLIVAGERALVSSSPERFLDRRGRVLSTHPIKGTRRRGETRGEDAALALELQHDPKERAENLMIVDLMRNDLSRICVPGTVRVDGFLRVETHPHVHQLVSTVTGELRPHTSLAEILASCFPGGSMTGAPKRSAVEILGDLERRPRGLYSGCFGWIDDSGGTALAMSIRCIEFRSDRSRFDTALIGAGGGITADSDPAREVAEKRLKAAPLLAALHL